MIHLKRHIHIALGYFLLVGLLGLFMRLFFVIPIPANFKFITHTHSHTALLGWVYICLTTLIYKLYFEKTRKQKAYLRIFWFTNFTLLGMFFSFPFQGYALFSIIFSTLFLFASYFFAWFVFKNIPEKYKNTYSYTCIKTALGYMVVSSIGPWTIGGVMSTLGSTSIWYKTSIYFYLHFQYNAWFILCLCGIVFYILEKFKIEINSDRFNSFFTWLNIGLVLSFFLSVLWVEPPRIFYILAGAGAVFQIIGFYKFYQIIWNKWKYLKPHFTRFIQLLFKLVAGFLVVKVLLQLLTAFPYFVKISSLYTDFVIGYLHWTFLGVISIALFAFLDFFKLLKLPKGIFALYFTGFVLSEFFIFYKGMAFWQGWPLFSEHSIILLTVSALLPLSIYILLLWNYISSESNEDLIK